MDPFLIYGSYGYSGGLIADEAVRRGMSVVLAGRDGAAVAAQAERLGLDYRVFDLDDVRLVRENVRDVAAVLNCAGPFSGTAQPMIAACLEARVHYLDISAELDNFAAAAALDDEAQRCGVMMVPGTGFDVVPSDCLALHLKETLPSATRLTLMIDTPGHVTRGTALTALEGLGRRPLVRRDGDLVPATGLPRTRRMRFGHGSRRFTLYSMGDLFTAYHSTGIDHIAVYIRLPAAAEAGLRLGGVVARLLALPWVRRRFVDRYLENLPGPAPEQRIRDRCYLFGRVEDDEGNVLERYLETPEAYALTARSAVHLMAMVLSGCVRPGYHSPASAFGSTAILEIDGVTGFSEALDGTRPVESSVVAPRRSSPSAGGFVEESGGTLSGSGLRQHEGDHRPDR